ncbi:MAG: hypothetical protein C4529_01565 [Deltaproteobacteria bacterium]|nr:MAG: hypothetical protein C4529_01565 [Deltaproteobacteria bacterium]
MAPPSGPGDDTRKSPLPFPRTFCVMSNWEGVRPTESRAIPPRRSGRIRIVTSGPESPRMKLARKAVTPAADSRWNISSERPDGSAEARARFRNASNRRSRLLSGQERRRTGFSLPRPSMTTSRPTGYIRTPDIPRLAP